MGAGNGRASARMLNFELFVVVSLGRGGISEVASLGDSSYSIQHRRARDNPPYRLMNFLELGI